jgi:phospholipid transport system transporter-binding protein
MTASKPLPIHHHDQGVAVNFSDDRSALEVMGSVNFKNVVKLRREGQRLLAQWSPAAATIDLQKIQNSDNSGLVLLVAWVEDAQKMKKTVTFRNVPEFLQRMAQVFGLQSILFNTV